uniref:Uncharacterized protein n=1 Tax=Arundo donax TaxID=35708 RepID=A0A0A9BJN8_ARUDO
MSYFRKQLNWFKILTIHLRPCMIHGSNPTFLPG